MSKRAICLKGEVWLEYPRRWWQLFRFENGWSRHRDGFGNPCWMRFYWTHEQRERLATLAQESEQDG